MNLNKNDDPFTSPIIVQKTRVLRPSDFVMLLSGIPKSLYQTMIKSLLATGMRYSEFIEFSKNPNHFRFIDKKIYLSQEIMTKKQKVRYKQRTVRLSHWGADAVQLFLLLQQELKRAKLRYGKNIETCVPDRRSHYDNLIRWGENAGMDTKGFSIKMTRKTIESWLMASYPRQEYITQILLSQGHIEKTALIHYVGLAFTNEDIKEMKQYLDGWILE